MRLLSVIVLGAAALGACLACKRGDGDGVERGDFTGEIVHAICDNVVGCCQAASRGVDLRRCEDDVMVPFIGPLNDGSLSYDSELAGKCIAALADAAKSCQAIDTTPCLDAFAGNVPPGGTCSSALDCVPGPARFAVCDQNHQCFQPPRARLGEPCAYTCIDGPDQSRCRAALQGTAGFNTGACHSADGVECGYSPEGNLVCLPFGTADCRDAEGEPCGTTGFCDTGSGRCFARVAIGQACGVAPCVHEGYCDNGVCAPLKPIATPCLENAECDTQRCDAGFCVAFSPAAAAMCHVQLQPE